MRHRIQRFFAYLAGVGALASLVTWGLVATSICANPRAPSPATQQVIAYNCHGMTVFMSPVQEALLHWLIPAFLVFGILGILLFLLSITTIRISVEVRRQKGSDSGAPGT